MKTNIENTQEVSNATHQNMTFYFIKKLYNLLIKGLMLLAFAFMVTLVIKNLDSKSLFDEYKFDVKNATDIP